MCAAGLHGIGIGRLSVEMAPSNRVDLVDIFPVGDDGFVPNVLEEVVGCFG